jgi:hypothetical protein
MGAVSESLGEDNPGHLSSLWCGVLKGKDRLTFRELKKGCKIGHPLSPGQSSKLYLEVSGLKAYRIWNYRVERHYCFIDQAEILDYPPFVIGSLPDTKNRSIIWAGAFY